MKITIVGSGASSVHFALTLLKKGYSVEMIDVGFENKKDILSKLNFIEIKKNYEDPVNFFLGESFEVVIPPDSEEIYRFPPSKSYVFKPVKNFSYIANGFYPLISFAKGGLAEAWTAGVYPFNDFELEDFPFDYNEIEPYYNEVSKRIGICGENDSLSQIFPIHEHILKSPQLDIHSQYLLEHYLNKKNNFDRFILGRSRIALLTEDKDHRKKCNLCGKCQWGCKNESLYVPSITLNECLKYKNFKYTKGIYIKYFIYKNGKITELIGEDISSGDTISFDIDVLVLGAGTISSAKIFLDSYYFNEKKIETLKGLMDNRQVIAPFITPKLITKQYEFESYQYHMLSAGIITENLKEYIHTQITTLKTSIIHPVISSLPIDYKTSIYLTRNMRAALGVVNLNFNDYKRDDNYITIKPTEKGTQLYINYIPEKDEKKKINNSLKFLQKNFIKLGAIMPSFQARVRKMGESVHYAGTLPMSKRKEHLKTNEYGRSYDFENLYFIDGSTFPFLPAKNITFTLMANATRIADKEF